MFHLGHSCDRLDSPAQVHDLAFCSDDRQVDVPGLADNLVQRLLCLLRVVHSAHLPTAVTRHDQAVCGAGDNEGDFHRIVSSTRLDFL